MFIALPVTADDKVAFFLQAFRKMGSDKTTSPGDAYPDLFGRPIRFGAVDAAKMISRCRHVEIVGFVDAVDQSIYWSLPCLDALKIRRFLHV